MASTVVAPGRCSVGAVVSQEETLPVTGTVVSLLSVPPETAVPVARKVMTSEEP